MPKWRGEEVTCLDQTKEVWSKADPDYMSRMMGVSWKKRIAWLRVATEIITSDGTVWEPGCGEGIMVEALPSQYSLLYQGIDLNEGFVKIAQERYGPQSPYPIASFAQGDLYDYLDNDFVFDWVIVSSLFGMFPEEETYNLIPRLWEKCRKGMSITTLNKSRYDNPRARKNRLTSHDPVELSNAVRDLPGVGYRSFQSEMRDGNLDRKMAIYAYRESYEGRKANVPEGVQ